MKHQIPRMSKSAIIIAAGVSVLVCLTLCFLNKLFLDRWEMHYGTFLPAVQADPDLRHLMLRIPSYTMFLIGNPWIGVLIPLFPLSLMLFGFWSGRFWFIFYSLVLLLICEVILLVIPAAPMI